MVRLMQFAASALVVVTLAALGCSSSNSSSGGGGNPISSAGCKTCLNTNCSNEAAACGTSTACQAFGTCADPCTNQACIQGCLQKNSDPSASALTTCFNTSCTSCLTAPAPSGTAGTGGNPAACPAAAGDAPCDTCLKQHCCPQINTCNADATCVSVAQQCDGSCTDSACLVSCAQQNGNASATALATCANTSCSTCASGGSGSGSSSGSSGGGTEPPGCLQSAPPAGTCPTGVAHDCPNGSPAGLTCTPAPSGTPGVPGPSGVYCCNG